MSWWNRVKFFFFPRLKAPDARTLDDLKDAEAWKNQFLSHLPNKTWLDKRQSILDKLLDLLIPSYTILQDPKALKLDLIRARRRYRFAVNRLGKLGYEGITDHIIQVMINQPWIFPVRRVSQDLALQDNETALIAIHEGLTERDGIEWAYIRASILKAFSELPKPSENVITLLQQEVIDGKSTIEKIIAGETLVLLSRDPGITKSDLTKLAQDAEHSALVKNYAILHALANGDDSLPQVNFGNSRTLNSALEYLRIDPALQYILREEPDIIRLTFYESDYDNENEFPEIPSWAY